MGLNDLEWSVKIIQTDNGFIVERTYDPFTDSDINVVQADTKGTAPALSKLFLLIAEAYGLDDITITVSDRKTTNERD